MGTILKGIFYFIKYTLPVQVVALFIFIGVLIGNNINESKYSLWKYDKQQEYTYRIVIYWDEEQKNYSEIYVREDINWSINGMCERCREELYSSCGHLNDVKLPAKASKKGYTFCGLGTSPYGGEMYINGAGYSLKQVTNDMKLYAIWEKDV